LPYLCVLEKGGEKGGTIGTEALAKQNFARILDRKATTIRLYLFISDRIYPLLLFVRMPFGKALDQTVFCL
jgi:hypothetical protein